MATVVSVNNVKVSLSEMKQILDTPMSTYKPDRVASPLSVNEMDALVKRNTKRMINGRQG